MGRRRPSHAAGGGGTRAACPPTCVGAPRALSGRSPLEAVVSKWYGESEQNLSKVFKAARQLGGCIIFLDELDSLAPDRCDRCARAAAAGWMPRTAVGGPPPPKASSAAAPARLPHRIHFLSPCITLCDCRENPSAHEASRRLLSVLLREIDGFETSEQRSIVIGATNRKADLDAALLSRQGVACALMQCLLSRVERDVLPAACAWVGSARGLAPSRCR